VLEALKAQMTVRNLLDELPALSDGIHTNAFPNVRKLLRDLEATWQEINGVTNSPESGCRAGYKLLELIDFKAIFTEFQADGRVDVNVQTLQEFCKLLQNCNVPLDGVEAFVQSFDSTRHKPLNECIKGTSIFKEKGREYNHVILPQVVEGQLPSYIANENLATDKQYPERWPARSSLIESERRLFYVAVTRAREGVYIYTSRNGNQRISRFIHESFIPQTVGAVDTVQGVMKRGTVTYEERQALLNAARHAELKAGLFNILRDAIQAVSSCWEAIQSLLPEICFASVETGVCLRGS
jgi:hypothetical protein